MYTSEITKAIKLLKTFKQFLNVNFIPFEKHRDKITSVDLKQICNEIREHILSIDSAEENSLKDYIEYNFSNTCLFMKIKSEKVVLNLIVKKSDINIEFEDLKDVEIMNDELNIKSQIFITTSSNIEKIKEIIELTVRISNS